MNDDRLICFDLGGVLIRICRSWEEGCAAGGVDPGGGWSPAQSGGCHHEIVLKYTIGAIETAQFFEELERLASGVYTAEDFRRIHGAWTREEYPGVVTLLHDLRDAGHRLACLSNTNAAHWEELIERPALAALHHRHASHVIGHAKPDERIYDWFVRATETAPHKIVFFDDLEENVQTGRRLGWDVVHVDHTGDTATQIRTELQRRSLL